MFKCLIPSLTKQLFVIPKALVGIAASKMQSDLECFHLPQTSIRTKMRIVYNYECFFMLFLLLGGRTGLCIFLVLIIRRWDCARKRVKLNHWLSSGTYSAAEKETMEERKKPQMLQMSLSYTLEFCRRSFFSCIQHAKCTTRRSHFCEPFLLTSFSLAGPNNYLNLPKINQNPQRNLPPQNS